MKMDYRLDIKIRNARILNLMKEVGCPTIIKLSKISGVNINSLWEMMRFKKLPISKKTGKWKESVTKLANFFGCLPEDMFPTKFLQDNIRLTSISCDFTEHQLESLHNPVNRLIGEEKTHIIQNAIATLDPRTQNVLSWKFGLYDGEQKTPKWITHKYRRSYETIRLIEKKGLKQLRKNLELNGFSNVKELET